MRRGFYYCSFSVGGENWVHRAPCTVHSTMEETYILDRCVELFFVTGIYHPLLAYVQPCDVHSK